MQRALPIVVAVLAASIAIAAAPAPAAPKPGVDWPQFRGIDANGIAEGFSLPATWNPATGLNIQWRTPIPGLGLSSPIVWGDDVFVTTAISGKSDASLKIGYYGDITPVKDDTEHEWRVYALDKRTGKIKWQQTAIKEVPKIKRHMKNSHANSTLATDGQRVIAFFGSEGLYAYDMKGTPLWKKDLGVLDAGFYMVPDAQWETGSSPVLYKGMVIVQADVQKNSFLAMFDAKDGREVWRTPRNDVPTWGTPTIHHVNGQTQILVNGMKHVGAYDFKTGKEIWSLSGGGDIPVPTPVVSDGLVYITNAHGPAAPVYAIKDTAVGDISLKGDATSNEHVAWSAPRTGGYMCTPLVYRGLVYIVRFNGVLVAFDARNGDKKYETRLGGATSAFTASPVANDGRVYIASEDGQIFVVKAGPAYEQIAMNEMSAPVLASPAISEGRLLLRTGAEVMSIGGK
jgi:outer membrane protein assembly factor BamB